MLLMKIEREARRRIDSADAPAGVGAQDGLLSAILELPEEPDFLVEDLVPYEGNVLISAQMKAGKTTLGLNLAKSLLTGEKFLGAKTVQRVAGRVGFMNYEVSARQFGQWAVKHGIDPQRLYTVNRRGQRNPLSYEDSRAELAAELKAHQVEVLIIDPFLKAFSGADDNSASEVDAWLSDIEAFAFEAGIRNIVLIAHAGKTGETTRGSSALEGWPDSIIRLSVNDKTQERYIKAFGRDVYLEKTKLAFDLGTKTLSLAGEVVTADKEQEAANRLQVLTTLGAPPFEFTKTSLAKAMPGNYKTNITTAEALIDELEGQNLLTAKTNGKGTTYTLTNLPPELLRQAAYTAN
jgi:RecA-family ATPase